MFEYLFGTASFMPHGYCLLWRPDIVAMHVTGDVLVFAAYTAIALAIRKFMRERPEFRFNGLAYLFAAFVFGCGIAHLFGAVSLWWPAYGAQAILKLMVALVSVGAAVAVWRSLPVILEIPTATKLQEDRDRLAAEINDRRRAEAAIRQRDLIQRQLIDNEAELRIALDAAKQAERAKAGFLAAMSHDLRTPLNAIIGFSDTLRLGIIKGLGRAREEEYFDHIHSSARHLLGLVNELLDLSALESGRAKLAPEELNVDDIVGHAVADAQIAANETGVKLSVSTCGLPSKIYADEVALRRMLSNLLGNAVKLSPTGGSIDVSIKVQGGKVRIVIIDDGPGFPEANIDWLRRPFEQADNRRDGIGLGLAIVDALAKAHGGALELANEPGRGAHVLIELPTYAERARTVAPAKSGPARALQNRLDGGLQIA